MQANSATIFKPASLQENSANSLFQDILRITSLYAGICEPSSQPGRVTINQINTLPGVIEKNMSQDLGQSSALLEFTRPGGPAPACPPVDPKAAPIAGS
jgi:hypothetical protein